VLKININVTNALILAFKDCTTVAHFAMNPVVGGRPAKVATIKITVHGLNLFEMSFVISFISIFLISIITRKTENQYNAVNVNNVFILINMANIIHPKLKIEERAMISKIVLVVICKALPTKVDNTIDKMIKGFIINISR
jgi:hypothetical protein